MEKGKLVELPCDIGTEIYLFVPCCRDCPDDEGDHCSCEKWLKREKKIIKDIVNAVCFNGKEYYLECRNGNRAYETEYNEKWFFEISKALHKQERVVRICFYDDRASPRKKNYLRSCREAAPESQIFLNQNQNAVFNWFLLRMKKK